MQQGVATKEAKGTQITTLTFTGFYNIKPARAISNFYCRCEFCTSKWPIDDIAIAINGGVL
jgi:hypothetical protein